MEKSATMHTQKAATKPTAKRQFTSLATCDSLIKHPIVFCISIYYAGAVRTLRTYNPAKAFTICNGVVKDNYPVSITLWLKVGTDYMMPLFYVATSERDLNKAFNSIAFDMANAEKILKPESNQLEKGERENANKERIQGGNAEAKSAETHD